MAASKRADRDDVQQLIDGLGSRSRKRVDSARARLAIMGERVVEPLIAVLSEGDTRRRCSAIGLLALIQDPRARGPLIEMLRERSSRLREAAARALGRFFEDTVVEAIERTLLDDRNDAVRVAAVTSLVEQYSAGQECAIRLVMSALQDDGETTDVRLAATQLLRCLSRAQRQVLLARLVEDADEPVARRAAEILATDALDSGSHRKRIDRLVDGLSAEDYASWNGAAEQLGKRGGRVVAPLVAEMRRRAHDPEFCRRAGIVFRMLGPRFARAIGDALPGVEEPLPIQVLVEVIGALGVKAQIYRLAELIERIADGDDRRLDDFDPLQRGRALAHLELARIGSRVAIADLRRYLSDPDRRAELEMIEAMAQIGKREELEILLGAWLREDTATRRAIGEAVRTIMKRERIRRNSRELKNLARAEKRALRTILPPVAVARRPTPPIRRRPAAP